MTCTCRTTSLQHSYGCPMWTDPLPLATENAKLKVEIETLRTALRRLVRLYESEHEPEGVWQRPEWIKEALGSFEPVNVMSPSGQSVLGMVMPAEYEDLRRTRTDNKE